MGKVLGSGVGWGQKALQNDQGGQVSWGQGTTPSGSLQSPGSLSILSTPNTPGVCTQVMYYSPKWSQGPCPVKMGAAPPSLALLV